RRAACETTFRVSRVQWQDFVRTQRAVTELHPSQSARSRRKHWLDERIRQRVGSASTTAHRIDDIQHDRRSPGAGLGARVSRWESLLAKGKAFDTVRFRWLLRRRIPT